MKTTEHTSQDDKSLRARSYFVFEENAIKVNWKWSWLITYQYLYTIANILCQSVCSIVKHLVDFNLTNFSVPLAILSIFLMLHTYENIQSLKQSEYAMSDQKQGWLVLRLRARWCWHHRHTVRNNRTAKKLKRYNWATKIESNHFALDVYSASNLCGEYTIYTVLVLYHIIVSNVFIC